MDDLCGYCDGSGEGMYDGSACSACHGSGIEGERERRIERLAMIADARRDELKDQLYDARP